MHAPENSSSVLSSQTAMTPTPIHTAAYVTGVVTNAHVRKVVDGDTIEVDLNGQKETIRMIGINTPETVDPRKPVECFGKEASNKGKEVLTGHDVRLEADPTQTDRDKYNRLLRYVFRDDGLFYNQFMVEQGYAYEYTYDAPYQYQKVFKDAQTEAETNGRGLWSSCPVVTKGTIKPTTAPVTNGQFTCDCNKTCGQMSSCDEAKFQLQQCGCKQRDPDHNGVPCESICK